MKLWDISIRQPVFMTMVLIAGVVMGIFSYFRMPVDVYPNIEFPVVVVTTIYPGANPTEVQDQVTTPLEEELATISGIDTVQSISSEGLSNIILQFKLDLLWSMLDAMTMAYELDRPPYHSVTDQRVWHKGITL